MKRIKTDTIKFNLYPLTRHIYMYVYSTVRYNAVNFFPKSSQRHPIARLTIYIPHPSLQRWMQHHVILYRLMTALTTHYFIRDGPLCSCECGWLRVHNYWVLFIFIRHVLNCRTSKFTPMCICKKAIFESFDIIYDKKQVLLFWWRSNRICSRVFEYQYHAG